ncbi:hypothetical protein CAJAP_10813 [Camponotus japonicus]
MQAMNITAGPNVHQYAFPEDSRRIIRAEHTAQDITKEARLRPRQIKLKLIEAVVSAEDSLYGSEMAELTHSVTHANTSDINDDISYIF